MQRHSARWVIAVTTIIVVAGVGGLSWAAFHSAGLSSARTLSPADLAEERTELVSTRLRVRGVVVAFDEKTCVLAPEEAPQPLLSVTFGRPQRVLVGPGTAIEVEGRFAGAGVLEDAVRVSSIGPSKYEDAQLAD